MMEGQNQALRRLTDGQTPKEAALLLDSLRWREDMLITNHFGERVWLGVATDEQGRRIGITDCCFESEPCEHHKATVEATP